MYYKNMQLQAFKRIMCHVLLPKRKSAVYLLLQHLHQHQQQWLLLIEQAIISESAPSSYHVSGQVKTISQPHRQKGCKRERTESINILWEEERNEMVWQSVEWEGVGWQNGEKGMVLKKHFVSTVFLNRVLGVKGPAF